MNNYAYFLETGKCGEVDIVTALEYYGRAIKNGHAGAMFNVGYMFEKRNWS